MDDISAPNKIIANNTKNGKYFYIKILKTAVRNVQNRTFYTYFQTKWLRVDEVNW